MASINVLGNPDSIVGAPFGTHVLVGYKSGDALASINNKGIIENAEHKNMLGYGTYSIDELLKEYLKPSKASDVILAIINKNINN